MLSPNTLCGFYRINHEIGRGGMSVIYHATDTRNGQIVALKVLLPHLVHDSVTLRRFRQEAENMQRLRHPNIVRVYEAGESEGYHYIAMEYASGGTLAQQLRQRNRPMSVPEALPILHKVADGLDYAHSRNILHRDVKPSNVLIGENGQIWLSDFGVARHLATDYTVVTLAGYSVGTPSYMSPEQARGDYDLDQRADIYSLGVVAYAMLTNNLPFDADSQLVLLRKIIDEPPVPPEKVNPELPAGVVFALQRVLAKDAPKRYVTAHEFVDAIQKGLTWKPSERDWSQLFRTVAASPSAKAAQVAPARPKRRSRAGVVVLALAMLIITAAAFLLLRSNRMPLTQWSMNNLLAQLGLIAMPTSEATATPLPSPTSIPTPLPAPSPTATESATATASPTATSTPTASETPTSPPPTDTATPVPPVILAPFSDNGLGIRLNLPQNWTQTRQAGEIKFESADRATWLFIAQPILDTMPANAQELLTQYLAAHDTIRNTVLRNQSERSVGGMTGVEQRYDAVLIGGTPSVVRLIGLVDGQRAFVFGASTAPSQVGVIDPLLDSIFASVELLPTPTPSSSATATASPTATETLVATDTPSATATATPSASATKMQETLVAVDISATVTPTATLAPTATPSPTASAIPTATATETEIPTATASPTWTRRPPTSTPAPTFTSVPTATFTPTATHSPTPLPTPTVDSQATADAQSTTVAQTVEAILVARAVEATATALSQAATLTAQATPTATATPTPTRTRPPTSTPAPTFTTTATHTPIPNTPTATSTPDLLITLTAISVKLTELAPYLASAVTEVATPTAAATEAPVAAPAPVATQAPVNPPAAVQSGLVTGFETFGNWRRGDQPYGTLTQSTAQVSEGRYVAELNYDFPTSAGNNNYVVFLAQPALKIPGTPAALQLQVYGDGSGHFLNLWIADAANHTWQFTFGRIQHQGWATLNAPLALNQPWPVGAIDGSTITELMPPLSLKAIVLDGVPDGAASKGVLYLDALQPAGEATVPSNAAPVAAPAQSQADVPAATPLVESAPPIAASALPGRIAYTVFNGSSSDIVVYNLSDGSRWPKYANRRQPDFGKTGILLANAEGGGSNNLIRIFSDGREVGVSSHAEDNFPQWSPTGKSLIYASSAQGDGRQRLYYQADASDQFDSPPLFFSSHEILGDYPIYLDNWRVAYQGCNYWASGSACGIYTTDTNGGQPSRATDQTSDVPSDGMGTRILFTAHREENWDVYVVNWDGSGLIRLTNSPGRDGLATASPDYQHIAFVSDREGSWAVYVMNMDGSGQQKLFDLNGGYGGGEQDWIRQRLSWGP